MLGSPLKLTLAGAAMAAVSGYKYDPSDRTDPFDAAAQAVSTWLKDSSLIKRKNDGWEYKFCDCMRNGYIASWYQYASMMYLMDTCTPDDGLILRTGHLQLRHVEPLQGMMSCDALKLITYCFSHHAQEALPAWNQTCRQAHYTVAACDVECSAAVPRAGGRAGVLVALAAACVMVVAPIVGLH